MIKPQDVSRRKYLYVGLIVALVSIIIGIAAWTAASSPVLSLNSDPTHARSFASVKIAKPLATNTVVLPTSLSPAKLSSTETTVAPSSVDLPVVLPTFESALSAEIVVDTPAPAYAAPDFQVSAAPAYGGNKYILVDISEQHMYVYEGSALVYSFVSSTGMYNATRAGSFSVLDKIPSAYGATWDIWMPNWLGIYWAGSMENGIHALPILPNGATLWAGYLGVPISYGCVVLGTYEAQLLYDWADIGTPVEIQW
jgi:lipoprotein-anchoring transpeptidase ErfK/SrfK